MKGRYYLTKRNVEILRMKEDGYTPAYISKIYHLTPRRINQICSSRASKKEMYVGALVRKLWKSGLYERDRIQEKYQLKPYEFDRIINETKRKGE